MPRGTEQDIVRMVCEPAKYKIQKGFVLVKLRSKEDIDHQVTLQQNAENEARFFLSQTHYRCETRVVNCTVLFMELFIFTKPIIRF